MKFNRLKVKKNQTYSYLSRISILLFIVCYSADVQSQSIVKGTEFGSIDLKQDYFECEALAVVSVIAKTNSFPVLFYDVSKHKDVFLILGATLDSKGVQLSSKIGLFILYSTLKIAPII